jgi:hypothetical protein
MDLRAYYRKLREVESQLPDKFVVIVSMDTPDGGKPGVMTEVSRLTAAKHVVENRARVATPEEADAFRSFHVEAKRLAEQELAASKMQFVVVPAKNRNKDQKD